MHNATSIDQSDTIRKRERFLLIMRDIEDRDPELAVQAANLGLQLLPQRAIKRAERLVHQQQTGLENEGAGERHPLLLTTGKLRRQTAPKLTETDAIEDRSASVWPRGTAAHAQRKGHVAQSRHMGNSA